MFCMKCGAELPPDSAFCFRCGERAGSGETVAATPKETCEIRCEEVREKLGIFPRNEYEFKAVATHTAKEKTIKSSVLIKAGMGDYYAPNPKNPRHAAALDRLAEELRSDGWTLVRQGKSSEHPCPWFALKFVR